MEGLLYSFPLLLFSNKDYNYFTNINNRRDKMRIGIPKEMKNNENRVAITPGGVLTLVNAGHEVFVETEAGVNSHFTNEAYQNVGAVIVEDSASVWANSELIMKVKEPIVEEYTYFRP